VKYWEIIADNLKKAGWSWGWVSAVDSEGRTIWIVDAHRDNGKRFVVRADDKFTAFLELESATRRSALGNRRTHDLYEGFFEIALVLVRLDHVARVTNLTNLPVSVLLTSLTSCGYRLQTIARMARRGSFPL